MKPRTFAYTALVGLPLLALIVWVAGNTQWVEVKVPMPPKGEALVNPFYATQRFTEALGARAAWDRTFTVPPADHVIVLSGFHWDLSARRRDALERWVESGGRLVVDWTLLGGEEFERWSGITRDRQGAHQHAGGDSSAAAEDGDQELEEGLEEGEREHAAAPEPFCHRFHEQQDAEAGTPASAHWLCDFDSHSSLTARGAVTWALRDEASIQAIRVQVGRGSVTAINANPFRYQNILIGDHGSIFAAAAQLRRGDQLHFLSEEEHPSLPALVWRHGAAVVVLALAALAAGLWRDATRFGPMAAPAPSARRSLGEQIRGTGTFALRHGGGDALHSASVRALTEAARRRIAGYAALPASAAAAALSTLTGYERNELLSAIYHPRLRRPGELRSTLALIETARRRTLDEHTRTSHDSQ